MTFGKYRQRVTTVVIWPSPCPSAAVTQENKELLASLWSNDQWRCEYWRIDGATWLILYYGGDLALQRRVANEAEARDTSRIWKDALRGFLPHILLPTLPSIRARRQLSDRRVVTRGGRRRLDKDETPDEQ